MKKRPKKKGLWFLIFVLLLGLLILFKTRTKNPPLPKEFDYIVYQANLLSKDRAKILSFVRDKIDHHNYRGILRGPVGTLWSGAGSPMDRAYLLGALLRASGEKVRYGRKKNTLWVQLFDEGKWKNFPLDGPEKKPTWTGKNPQEDLFHRFSLRVETGGKKNREKKELNLFTADLVENPFLLRYEKGKWILSSLNKKGKKLTGKWNTSKDEEQRIYFTYFNPFSKGKIAFSREIYSRQYPLYRSLDHPSNEHLIFGHSSFVTPWVFEKEKELARGLRRFSFSTSGAKSSYLFLLTYMKESDRMIMPMEKHFKVKGYFTAPRVLIASVYKGHNKEEENYRALDLRKNDLHVEGDSKAIFSFTFARSQYEGSLEGILLEKATGKKALTAFKIFQGLFRQKIPSTPNRLYYYKKTMDLFFQQAPSGAKLHFYFGKNRVSLVHRRDHLQISSIEPLPLYQKSEVKWKKLKKKGKVSKDEFPLLACEIETFFGPVCQGETDYWPKMKLEEPDSIEDILSQGRVFLYAKVGKKKERRLTFEYQILSTKKDLSYEVRDYWDDDWEKPQYISSRYRIEKSVWEKGRVYAIYHSYYLHYKGFLSLLFSKEMHREIKEKGETTYRYGFYSRSTTGPIRLFLCKKTKETLYINHQKREVPVLWLAGDYQEKKPKMRKYEEVKEIRVHDLRQTCINKLALLDSKIFPITFGYLKDAHIQTAICGTLSSSKNGSPVEGARISISRTASQGVSWPSGYFRLPPIKKPFGVFQVQVDHPDYLPFRKKIDFRKEEVFPLRIELTPKPRGRRDLLFVTSKNFKEIMKKARCFSRVKDLVARDLQEQGSISILLPSRPIPYGMTFVHPYLIFNHRTGQVIGVTDDGLYGASILGAFLKPIRNIGKALKEEAEERAKEFGKEEFFDALGVEIGWVFIQKQVVGAFAGYWASWYAYSAGRLKAVDLMVFEDRKFRDSGHEFALKFSFQWLGHFKDLMDNLPRPAGYPTKAFQYGFMEGLKYLKKNLHPLKSK